MESLLAAWAQLQTQTSLSHIILHFLSLSTIILSVLEPSSTLSIWFGLNLVCNLFTFLSKHQYLPIMSFGLYLPYFDFKIKRRECICFLQHVRYSADKQREGRGGEDGFTGNSEENCWSNTKMYSEKKNLKKWQCFDKAWCFYLRVPQLTSPEAGSTAFSRSDTAPASVLAALIRSLPPPTSSSISAANSFTPFDISVRLEEMVVMAQPTAV